MEKGPVGVGRGIVSFSAVSCCVCMYVYTVPKRRGSCLGP